jgi:hypothetical protein
MNSIIVTVISAVLHSMVQPQPQQPNITGQASNVLITCRSDDNLVTLSFSVPLNQAPMIGTRFSLNLEQLISVGARIGENPHESS